MASLWSEDVRRSRRWASARGFRDILSCFWTYREVQTKTRAKVNIQVTISNIYRNEYNILAMISPLFKMIFTILLIGEYPEQ